MRHAIGYFDLREWTHQAALAGTHRSVCVALVRESEPTPHLTVRAGFVHEGVLHYWRLVVALLDSGDLAQRQAAAAAAHRAIREWLDERLLTAEAVVHLPAGPLVRGYTPYLRFDAATYTWQPADPDAAPVAVGEVAGGPDAPGAA